MSSISSTAATIAECLPIAKFVPVASGSYAFAQRQKAVLADRVRHAHHNDVYLFTMSM